MLPDLTNDPRWAIPSHDKSAFLASAVKEREEYMRKDLAASGLVPEQVRAYVDDLMPLSEGAKGGYYLPYFDLDGRIMRANGQLTMYRIRQYGSEQRYTQPGKGTLNELHLPICVPYILPQVHEYCAEQKTLYICEGEKKAAAVCDRLDVGAIGIGGCWNWGIKKRLHPWIKELLERHSIEKVVVVPDGDIKRYDICTAYGTLADELRQLSVGVEIVKLPKPDDKIDDLLVAWGIDAPGEFDSLGKLGADQLVVSQHALAEQYGLSTSGKEARVVVNDTNVRKLLEMHPAFDGGFWLNCDTNTYMYGDEEVVWDLTDYNLTTYMQHYFQLHNLNRPRVAEAVRAIADTNKRSPFLEWVQSKPWDGEERLETWPIRLWGCEDNPITREVGKKFMVGMCARMMEPGCKMDWMMVTVGEQGIGKSWWAELVTRGNSVIFMASGNARDDAAKMHKGLVICIDELDAFNKREMTYWKTMISANVDTYRAPYGRGEVTMKRNSVLYGTSNHRTFLRHDDTGHRRFGVLEPTRMLDVEGFKGELQQLWAEALSTFRAGEFRYFELSNEVKAQTAEQFAGEDPFAERVREFLEQWPGDRFKMVDMLRELDMNNHVQNRAVTGQLKDMMMSRGWAEYRSKLRVGGSSGVAGYIINREAVPRKEL
jgi:predicted P-loop ATPase